MKPLLYHTSYGTLSSCTRLSNKSSGIQYICLTYFTGSLGTINNNVAQVRSVVADKSIPPIPYRGFNAAISKVAVLLSCSNVKNASDEVSRILKSFVKRLVTWIGLFCAVFTFSANWLALLIVPSPGLAFAQQLGSVHSFRLSNS